MAYAECISCAVPMCGILDSVIRDTCHECGGKSLDEERLAASKEEASQRAKEYGELSRKYKFRRDGGSHI